MRTIYAWSFFMLFLCGCNVRRSRTSERADSITTREVSLSREQNQRSVNLDSRLIVVSDSSGQEFTTEIIPAGAFHYSASEGFTGIASRILMVGKLQSKNSKRELTHVRKSVESSDSQSALSHAQTQKLQTRTAKEVSRSSGIWIWLVSGVLCVVLSMLLDSKWREWFCEFCDDLRKK